MSTIEVESLTKRFGRTTAVDELSFTVPPGTVTGFLGPNGAGKTTTLRVLLGLISPTEGSATVGRRPFRELADPARTVGAVLENARFHPGRTARHHLQVLATAAGVPRGRADEVLAFVGLEPYAGQRVRSYSMGMRQRLALAASLLGDPEILVLDEPGNGLDPQGMRWLRDFLRARAAEGRTVLVSSHVLAEMEQTVDEVVVIGRGRSVAQGSLEELTAGTGGTVRVRSPDAERLAAALAGTGVRVQLESLDTLIARGTTTEAVGDLAVAEAIRLHELVSVATSLEDVFLELTGTDDVAGPQAGAVR